MTVTEDPAVQVIATALAASWATDQAADVNVDAEAVASALRAAGHLNDVGLRKQALLAEVFAERVKRKAALLADVIAERNELRDQLAAALNPDEVSVPRGQLAAFRNWLRNCAAQTDEDDLGDVRPTRLAAFGAEALRQGADTFARLDPSTKENA